MKTLSTVVLFLLLASAAYGQDSAASAAAGTACGDTKVTFNVTTDKNRHPLVPPEAGKATAYVAEVVGPGGLSNPTLKLGLDGAWVGAVQGNSYFGFSVDPGEHHLCASWQSRVAWLSRNVSFNLFTAQAGRVYYFQVRVVVLQGGFSLDLEPVNEDEGKWLVETSPYSTAHPKG
jgi:hypothetical protein